MTVSQRVFDITLLRARASVGGVANASLHDIRRTYKNVTGAAGQVDTWTYAGFTAGHVIGGAIVFPGGYEEEVLYTVLAGDTNVTGAMTKLMEKIRKDHPSINGVLAITQNGGELTFTGRNESITWTSKAGTGTSGMTLANVTNPSNAESIAVGRGLVLNSSAFDSSGVDGVRGVTLPRESAFTAQTIDHLFVFDDGVDVTMNVEILSGRYEGSVYSGTITMATGLSTAVAALATEINAQLPANTLDAAATDSGGGDDGVRLTAEKTVVKARTWVTFGGGRDTGACTITAANSKLPRNQLGGISVRSYDDAPDTFEPVSESYAPKAGVKALRGGGVWVSSPAGYTGAAGEVWMGSASGEEGFCFPDASDTRFRLDPSQAYILGGDSTLMLVELRSL